MIDLVLFQCRKLGCEYHPYTPDGKGLAMKAYDVLKIKEFVKCPKCQSTMKCRESEELIEDLMEETEWKAKVNAQWDAFEKYLRGQSDN